MGIDRDGGVTFALARSDAMEIERRRATEGSSQTLSSLLLSSWSMKEFNLGEGGASQRAHCHLVFSFVWLVDEFIISN